MPGFHFLPKRNECYMTARFIHITILVHIGNIDLNEEGNERVRYIGITTVISKKDLK